MFTILMHYAFALMAAAAFWPVAMLVFAGGAYGSPKWITFVHGFGTAFAKLPPTALFTCLNGKVTVTVVDRVKRAERSLTAWHLKGPMTKVTLLTWNGPPKSGARIRIRLIAELIFRCFAFLTFVALPIGVAIWLGFTSHWLWICGALVVAASAVFSTLTEKMLVLNPLALFRLVSFLFFGCVVGRWVADKLGLEWLRDWLNLLGGLSTDWHDRIVPVVVSGTALVVLATAVLVWADKP